LRALGFLDRVFGGPPVEDPVYRAHRSQTLIISVDCATPHETCFCSLVEGRPYAETNFDVNLTPVPGGYVVEAGSEAGHEYLKGAQDLVSSATEAQSRGRDETRTAAASQLEKQNADRAPSRSPADVLGGTENDDRWQELSAGCVECGACTQICPTCHCFFLNDRASGHEGYERLRAWDSCMWSGYSRMAGAERMKPNPRPQFRTRFANRYLHKFVWAPQQWDTLGCVGCGRCVEACPGKIDIRSVLQEAVA
jgi:ferredoxin